MVKSKKMSKTSIAVIVLALLLVLSMVLGLTGAWFTDMDSKTASGESALKFGHIGNVSVSLSDASVSPDASTRGYLMPGDSVTSQSLTLVYEDNDELSTELGASYHPEANVWHLIVATKSGEDTVYYVVKPAASGENADAHSSLFAVTKATYTEALGKIAEGTTRVVPAEAVYVSDSNGQNPVEVTAANAHLITNAYQGRSLDAITAVSVRGGWKYEARILQFTNQPSAEAAWDILVGSLIIEN